MNKRRALILALLVPLVGTVFSCGGSEGGDTSSEDPLSVAISRWRSAQPRRYRLLVVPSGGLSIPIEIKTTVENGVIIEKSVRYVTSPEPFGDDSALINSYGTVERLFETARTYENTDGNASIIRTVVYDSVLGYPKSLAVMPRPDSGIADGDSLITVELSVVE